MKIIPVIVLMLIITTGCKKAVTQNKLTVKDITKEKKRYNETDVYCSVPSSPTNNTEMQYAEGVSQNTMAEKGFCRLAERKATKESVRSFAAKISFENDTVNDPFIQIIIKKKIRLVDGLRRELQRELTTLERTTKDINQAFLKAIILNYQRSVTAYERSLP